MAFSMNTKPEAYLTKNSKRLLRWKLKLKNYKKWYRKIMHWIRWEDQRWVNRLRLDEHFGLNPIWKILWIWFISIVHRSEVRHHLVFRWDFHWFYEVSHYDPWNGAGVCTNQNELGKYLRFLSKKNWNIRHSLLFSFVNSIPINFLLFKSIRYRKPKRRNSPINCFRYQF